MSTRPPLAVIRGPARSGKTAQALARLAAVDGAIVAVVPSRAYRERLRAELQSSTVDDRIRFDTPLELLKRLAGVATDGRLVSPSVVRLTVSALARAQIAPEGYFARVLDVPGFPEALTGLIGEMKRSLIGPSELERVAAAVAHEVDDPNFRRKVAEVVQVYAAYERTLAENSQVDEDDLPLQAARRIAADPASLNMRALALIGIHRLSAAMRELLRSLAGAGVYVVVTLPHDEGRPLLFATTQRTLATLREEFAVEEVRLEHALITETPSMLSALERGLWGTRTGAQPDDGTVHLLDAPNPYTEAEMVARELVREHTERGVPWSRCAILARSATEAAPTMAAACAKLGIPLEVRTGRRLADDPAVRRLQAFLEMVARDWMRDDVIAFLKIGCGPGARLGADWLQRRARRKAVRVGRDAWRDLLSEPDIATRAQVEELVRALQWDAALRSGPRDASEWVQALGPVVESLLPGAPDGRGKPGSIRRALDAALTDVQRASAITSRGPSGFAAFQRDLVAVLRSVPLPPRPRPDAVALLDANESRERDIACAAVTGLVEKVYPRRVNEDPFFRDDERDALSRGGLELEPRRNGVDEERLLFYTNITAPKQRLLLSYPRASAEQDALRSFYLDEVETALGGLPATTRRLDDVAPRPEDCVDDRDRVLSACSLLSADEDECGAPDADALRSRISARGIPVDDAALLRVIRVLSTRSLPRAPSLASAASARAYSERRPYRVTEIETYAECPFRHFAQYGLRLRPDEDGVTRASAGSVYHGVLRRYFRGRAGSGSADADTIQKALGADLASVLADTVVDAAGFRRRLFDRSLADALGGFAGREARLRDVFGMEPSRFELAFGPRAGGDSGEDGGPPDDDPASDVQPLRIEQPGGPQIELCGTIDRVDLDDDGKRALVLDYKLGNAPEYREIEAGQSIQLPLYVLAAEQVFGFVGVGACYDTPREKGRPRFFRRQHADERRLGPVPDMDDGRHVRPLTEGQFAELVERAREVVRAVVAGIACGGIAPVPGDHCDYCPYSGICRTTAGPDHDGEPLPLGSAAPEPVT